MANVYKSGVTLLSVALLELIFISATAFAANPKSGRRVAQPFFERHIYSLEFKKSILNQNRNLSAITFHAPSKTFYIVDDMGWIFQVKSDGSQVSSIPLTGFEDPEGILFVSGKKFALVEEERCMLTLIDIDEKTIRLNKTTGQVVPVYKPVPGDGLKGVAFDQENDRFILVKQNSPKKIFHLKISGDKPMVYEPFDAELIPLKDLSDVYYDPRLSSHVFVLGKRSKRILEIDKQGEVVSSFSLIPYVYLGQTNGLTFDDKKRMCIVVEEAEENFFCFTPK